MELNKYYLTAKGTIIKATNSLHCENPLTRYGLVGAIDSDFAHLANTSMPYSEALVTCPTDRLIPIEVFTHSDSNFYECDENPCLFVILEEEIANDSTDLAKLKKQLIKDFTAWYNGYVYDIIEYNLDLQMIDCFETFDYYESEIKANYTIREDVTNLVKAAWQDRTHKEAILSIIKSKEVRG